MMPKILKVGLLPSLDTKQTKQLGMKPYKIRGYKTVHTNWTIQQSFKPEIVFKSLKYLNLRIRCAIDLRFYFLC